MVKNKKEKKNITNKTEVETTGHEWDGIKEYRNPVPRWSLIVFIVCVIFAIFYIILYPGIPTISGKGTRGGTEGLLGWTQYNQLSKSQEEIVARRAKYLEKFHTKTNKEVLSDPELYEFALAGGKSAFKSNCAQCHGSDAAGSKGYPNLNDNDWLRGGSLEEIYTTLKKGIRSNHKDTFVSEMPAFGELLSNKEIADVVDYVLSLSDKKVKSSSEGAKVFADNCAQCHGSDAKGIKSFGAPNLSDAIWLYGGERKDIYSQVTNPKHGVMPSWEGKLDNDTLRQLTIYVYSLGSKK